MAAWKLLSWTDLSSPHGGKTPEKTFSSPKLEDWVVKYLMKKLKNPTKEDTLLQYITEHVPDILNCILIVVFPELKMDWNNTVLYPGQWKLIFPPGSSAASLSLVISILCISSTLPAETKFAELIWTRIWPQSVVLQTSLVVRWSAAEFHRFLLLEDLRLEQYAKERENPKIHVLERVEEL